MNRRRSIILGAVAVAAGAALFGWSRLQDGREEGVLRLSGNVEVTDVDVSFKVPGRVKARLVDEGAAVARGQVVAVLDAEDLEREAGVKEAEAAAVRASLAELLAGSRPQEIARAEAAVARAEAEAVRLAREDERIAALYGREAVARREFEAAKAAADVAQARLAEARESLLLVREGPRRETIAQARARVRQADEAAALARTRLSYATVRSPLAGIVLSKNAEPGDYVSAGTPVVTVGDLRNAWVRAYVEETDLARVKAGQAVAITNDTYPAKRYAGRVSFISAEAEFTPKSVQTRKERVKLVYRIKVDVDNPAMELKPGMPVDGVIDTAGKAEDPGGVHKDR
ncbi:MAG: efflux RND transporter periplasmic adaptor subunit [Deltaproteobacteria bacterium]